MAVRNEGWVLGLSLRAAMLFVDEMVVLDHASTDGTPDLIERIAAEHPGRVHRLTERDPVWREAAIRQRLLDTARAAGATHLCPIDADEVLTGNLLREVRGRFAALAPGETLSLPWIALWGGLDTYRDDPSRLAQRVMILGYRDAPGLHYAPLPGGFDFHTRRLRGTAGDRSFGSERSAGGVLHLATVDRRRLVAKTVWYKMIEAVRFPWRRSPAERDAMYADHYLDREDVRTRPVPASWWEPYLRWRCEVDLEAGLWYEHECRRLREEHAEVFSGLGPWSVAAGAESAE